MIGEKLPVAEFNVILAKYPLADWTPVKSLKAASKNWVVAPVGVQAVPLRVFSLRTWLQQCATWGSQI